MMKKIKFWLLAVMVLSVFGSAVQAQGTWLGVTGTWQYNSTTGQYRGNFGNSGLYSPFTTFLNKSDSLATVPSDYVTQGYLSGGNGTINIGNIISGNALLTLSPSAQLVNLQVNSNRLIITSSSIGIESGLNYVFIANNSQSPVMIDPQGFGWQYSTDYSASWTPGAYGYNPLAIGDIGWSYNTFAPKTGSTSYAPISGSSAYTYTSSNGINKNSNNFTADTTFLKSKIAALSDYNILKSAINSTNNLKANKVNVRVYIIVGESNAAGEVPIAEANSTDTIVNNHVYILNNSNLQIQPLHVGVNANINLNSSNSYFGFEVPILENVPLTDTAYIVKTGYAGATIASLTSMLPTAYSYIDTAFKQIRALGKNPVPYIIYSQGINDEGITDTVTWRNATLSYIRSIRNHMGYAPVLMTQFMTAYNSFNPTIVNIENYDDWDYPISATGTTTGTNGAQHWNKAGLVLLYTRMLYTMNTTIGTKENYLKTEEDRAGLQNYPVLKSITLAPTFGSLNWGGTNTTQDNILLYDGGSSSSRTGIGLNSLSANLQIFANSAANAGTINFGVGFNASTLTATNGAMSIDGNNKVHVINQLLFGTSSTANVQGNYILFYDGGSTSTRTGLGLTNNSNSTLSLFGASEIRMATTKDVSNITDANAALYINSANQVGLNGQVNINGLLSYGSANVTGSGIRLYDGGTSSTRTGFTLNSSQAHGVIYSYGPSGMLLFIVGGDETSTTASNAAGGINSSNNFFFNGAPIFNGSIALNGKVNVSTATNSASSSVTLSAGAATISNTSVTASSLIFLTRKTAGGTVGNYSYTVSAGSSFTITSTSSTDTSTIGYLIIN